MSEERLVYEAEYRGLEAAHYKILEAGHRISKLQEELSREKALLGGLMERHLQVMDSLRDYRALGVPPWIKNLIAPPGLEEPE